MNKKPNNLQDILNSVDRVFGDPNVAFSIDRMTRDKIIMLLVSSVKDAFEAVRPSNFPLGSKYHQDDPIVRDYDTKVKEFLGEVGE